MKDYLLIFFAVALLSLNFIMQKLYQRTTDSTTRSGVNFSICTAICSFLIFFCANGFTLRLTPFSVLMAVLQSVCCLGYRLISFHILKKGSVALYTLFLMSGGMVVPFLFGGLFLGETIPPLRIVGILLILFSIVLSHLGERRPGKKELLLCVAVFFLNGCVSVCSKLHQINTVYDSVDTLDYVLINNMISLVVGLLLRFTVARGMQSETAPRHRALHPKPLLIVAGYSVLGGLSSFWQLEGARSLPASVLYPMITGGTVALSGLFALICFGERLKKREWLGIGLCILGTCLFL